MEDNKTRRVVPKTEARERLGGISLTTLNQLVKNGELISVKIGRRSMVLVSSLDVYLDKITEGAK
jgi:hypothetical protein